MRLDVRCFAGLAAKAPPGGLLELPEGATALDALDRLDLVPEDVKLIFINGRHAEPDQLLRDQDRVAFVPAVGGG